MNNFTARGRNGLSTTAMAAAIIVLLVVAGGTSYFVGLSNAGTTTSTATSTITQTAAPVTQTVNAPNFQTITQTQTVTSTLQSQADLAQKECAAQQGACLTYYSQVAPSTALNVNFPAFYAQYPWAAGKLNVVNFSSSPSAPVNAMALASKALADYKAGNQPADIAATTPQNVLGTLLPAGAIQNYTSPVLAQMNYPKDSSDPNGAWAVVSENIGVLLYNPKLTASGNLPIPSSWADLANPIYKGQFALGQVSTGIPATAAFFYLYTQMGNVSWTQLMKSIAANSPDVTTTGSLAVPVAAGKYPFAFGTYANYLTQHALTPDSIAYKAFTPTTYVGSVVFLLKNGPHPQMARLYEDWLLSTSGQFAIGQGGVVAPAQPRIANIMGVAPPTAVSYANAYSNLAFVMNQNTWATTFKNIFGG